MESLYAKLYKKYSELKKDKESEFDKLNQDQENKFMNYMTAADEMIQHLKSETERLYGKVDELSKELASVRSSGDRKEQNHFQKLWLEENQKNKKLADKVARLQGLEHNKGSHHEHLERSTGQQNNSDNNNQDIVLQPTCCSRKIFISGSSERAGSINCVFQDLVELVHGLNLSVANQNDELCIMARHPSSGYSFSLTLATNPSGETEFLYRVISLGMMERIAPGWMKEEAIIFSPNMCKVFFERLSRALKA